MNHSKIRHVVEIVAILGLVIFGITYLKVGGENAQVVGLLIAGIAGLGGYKIAHDEQD